MFVLPRGEIKIQILMIHRQGHSSHSQELPFCAFHPVHYSGRRRSLVREGTKL